MMNSIQHTASFDIDQPVEKVFPLFSPEGEKRWVPGWDYENVMGTTDLQEDYVFLTEHHDHVSTEAIWLVKQYDPGSHHVQFYKVEPEDKIGVITVQCTGLTDMRTKTEITYKYIGLSKKGNAFISAFTAAEYQRFISEWKHLLVEYFERET